MTKAKAYLKAPSGEVFESSYPNAHKDCIELTAKQYKVELPVYLANKLRSLLPRCSSVYSILRKRSASGCSGVYDFYCIHDNNMVRLSGYMSKLMDLPYVDKLDGVRVYSSASTSCDLARMLWGNGGDLAAERL